MDLCEELKIKKYFSTSLQPQANGQMETINKTIKYTLNELRRCSSISSMKWKINPK